MQQERRPNRVLLAAHAEASLEEMFLTDDQLRQLTGYTRKHKQIARLRELGIPFIPSAAGFPVVAAREVERRLVQDPKIRVKDRPRLEMVK